MPKLAEKRYEANEVTCPFYRFEKGNSLYCEGIYGGGIIQTFPTKTHKMLHKIKYCHSIESCKECKLHQAINEKYGRCDNA